jgi:hypothetical protein
MSGAANRIIPERYGRDHVSSMRASLFHVSTLQRPPAGARPRRVRSADIDRGPAAGVLIREYAMPTEAQAARCLLDTISAIAEREVLAGRHPRCAARDLGDVDDGDSRLPSDRASPSRCVRAPNLAASVSLILGCLRSLSRKYSEISNLFSLHLATLDPYFDVRIIAQILGSAVLPNMPMCAKGIQAPELWGDC